MNDQCIVIGASHAAAQLVASLRQEGWQRDILMVGDEPHLPYQRPPLSKAFLAGEKDATSLAIRPASFYSKHQIAYQQEWVSSIDNAAKTITLSDGQVLPYGKLVLCTGARARRLDLPGSDLRGVHYLRDLADAEGIRAQLNQTRSAVIIGGGYIGLETAASLRKQGVEVTVLEAGERVLQRVTAPEVSAFYQRVHRQHGVTIHTGVVVSEIAGNGRAEKVVCANGNEYAADIVIVGIGVVPNVELAEAAGLKTDNGILVDACGRTDDPDIFAVGDCSNQPNQRYGRRIRLESVPNAGDQAKAAAAAICGKDKPNQSLPWFWSDQYDLKLQIAGLSQGFDQVVFRGDHQNGESFAAFYLRDGDLIAADCVNDPKAFMLSKKLITAQCTFDPALLADENQTAEMLLTKVRAA